MISALGVLLSQLLYFCAANTIYEGPCQYVNDTTTHLNMTHTVGAYLEDAIFIPHIARNPLGREYASGYHQGSSMRRYNSTRWTDINYSHVHSVLVELLATFNGSLNSTDKCVPYGCKAIKCSLPGAVAIDVNVSCAIGNSSAMLSRYLKSDFEDYLKKLHKNLSWDYELAENALHEKFVEAKIKEGYLWSKITKPILRVDYYSVLNLVKDIIPTIFTDNEKETIRRYKDVAGYGCIVRAHSENLLLDVACLIHNGTHKGPAAEK
ncbi:hypothetical protein Q1695_004051 [Nippostrongylus brasiliensis]|nr:hypothetical protein Q1695_004051 [Nippostrongylus brasiliensis]